MKNTSLDTEQISGRLIAYLRNELKNPEIDYAVNLKQLQGGYETSIYRFQLQGARAEYSHALVLRLYPQFYGPQNAIWESKVQNILADVGYPVAKVHFLCTDMSILGGAFFIMDYIPGQILMSTTLETALETLGKTHAELHLIDPQRLSDGLKEAEINEYAYRLDARLDTLKDKGQKLPWIREGVNWLLENRPTEPKRLSICHGDFHPLNILIADGIVTGVLDWAGFVIADPVFDVANTLVLITIPVKHLIEVPDELSGVDWNFAAEQYLSAYQQYRDLDATNLDYYRVRRCLLALIQGVEGQKVWQHPLIVRDLTRYIQQIAGIQIELPA